MAANPELATRPAPPAWQRRIGAFWRWWTGELTAFGRERLGELVQAARAPMLSVQGEALVLLERRENRLEEAARLQMEGLDLEGRRKALGEVLARAGEDARRVRLVLPREQALLRRISLPIATEENLDQVLSFEMDRLTPFAAQDVYFGHRVASRNGATEKIDVDFAVARRELVDAMVVHVSEIGAKVQGVLLADDAARSDKPIDLLPEARLGERGDGEARLVRQVLLGTVVVLALVALVLPVWQKRETVVALLPQVDRARIEAEATGKLAAELEKLTGDYNFLLARKYANPPALAYIEEMSRLLPDQTWVSQLDLRQTGKNRELQIQGETSSASSLIQVLEQSTLVQNAAPRGQVTRGMMPGTERFLIAAEAKPGVAPERQPAASLPVPVNAPPVAAAAPTGAAAPNASPPAAPNGSPAATPHSAPTATPNGAPPAAPADTKAAPKAAEVKPVDAKAPPPKAPPAAVPKGPPAKS